MHGIRTGRRVRLRSENHLFVRVEREARVSSVKNPPVESVLQVEAETPCGNACPLGITCRIDLLPIQARPREAEDFLRKSANIASPSETPAPLSKNYQARQKKRAAPKISGTAR